MGVVAPGEKKMSGYISYPPLLSELSNRGYWDGQGV